MSLDSLIYDSGMEVTITAEAPDGQVPGQTAIGGADRSDANWVDVADGFPCLLRMQGSQIDYDRNDARAMVEQGRIYMIYDPVPAAISSRNRIKVTIPGEGGRRVLGVFAVTGVTDPNSMGRLLQVDVERIRVSPDG